MKPSEIPELNLLINAVEKKYGKKITSPAGFEALSMVLEHELGESLSASTLKRLWGYVDSKMTPRINSLDVLAKYAMGGTFKAFCKQIAATSGQESHFFSAQCLLASDLSKGDTVTLGWEPSRVVKLKYLGNNEFEVTKSVNSKLMEGDRFESDSFILGYPLYISRILRNGEYTSPYIAAKTNGLTTLKRG